jgi:hypothetical protein
MSAVIGVLACAALFATFGLLHRGRRPRIGCAACDGTCGRECRYGDQEADHGTH